MNPGGCEEALQTELPALLRTLHASGGDSTINISHHVDAQGGCEFTIEVIRPHDKSGLDQPWEYRWP